MKSVKTLKHPDIIKVDGEEFQVLNNTSLWYHTDKNKLEMVVELVKIGESKMTPIYRLTYFYEQPRKVKFFFFDSHSKEFLEKKIKSLEI